MRNDVVFLFATKTMIGDRVAKTMGDKEKK